MGGISLTERGLVVERSPNELDDLAIEFSEILSNHDVSHVYVSGYVAILAGRSRATEDIDVLVEQMDHGTIQAIVASLEDAGFWGPAMPLERMSEMLEDHIWIARDGEMAPHLECKYASDRFDRASLGNRILAHIDGASIPIGPMELQIAYKLWLGSRTDIEDAIHLYTLFEETLSIDRLEDWVHELGVEEEYGQLRTH